MPIAAVLGALCVSAFHAVQVGYRRSYGTANAEARRTQRTLQVVYHSANAVTKDRHIEIDQQTQLLVGEAEIRKKLR
jgi:hypothetical protein